MIHARKDYNRIQDPARIIPEDEPVFLIRGQDFNAPATVQYWADRYLSCGGDPAMHAMAIEQARKMWEWQQVHGSKIPDLQ